MQIKANIGIPKLKRTKQFELSEEQSRALHNKKVGETIKGELIDLPGYEFLITGGSDAAGFPMRKDVALTGRKRILTMRGIGNRRSRPGMRLRRTVAGAIIGPSTAQVNFKVTKEGKRPLIDANAAAVEKKGE